MGMKGRLWRILILLSWTVSVSATNTTIEEIEVCSLDKDDKPPRPRIILLGETGVGKSTFGNRLFKGYKEEEDYDYYDNYTADFEIDSIVQKDSYLDKSQSKEFGVGHGMVSHTNETVWRVGRWLGET